MFALLTPTNATLVNVNPRDEKHGVADVLAVDLSFRADLPAHMLAMFHAELPGLLYLPPDADGQAPIPGEENVSTVLRCPDVEPVRLKAKLAGRNVTISRATSDLLLATCKVGKFVADAKEGGTVALSFQVQCSGVEGETIGELCGMLNHSVPLTIAESQAAEDDRQAGEAGRTRRRRSLRLHDPPRPLAIGRSRRERPNTPHQINKERA